MQWRNVRFCIQQEKIRDKEAAGKMYVNSGYLFHSRIPFKETKMALRILSAGTYQLRTRPKLPTWRPKGRVDWQLIYICAGEGHFLLNGKDVVVPAGNMVLYQPRQEQHYYFLGKDKAQYWFVHFSGRTVKSILRHYGIPLDGYILHTGISYEYEDLFERMRDELTECPWGYEEMLLYLFYYPLRRLQEYQSYSEKLYRNLQNLHKQIDKLHPLCLY